MRSDAADESPRRGRPPSPAQNALGEYLRELRSERGWTIRELAREVGLSDSAAGYISQLESGMKSPHADLARKLVEKLGDPKGIFPLWAQLGARNDPYRSALARRALAHVLGDPSINYDPRFSRPGQFRHERGESQRFETSQGALASLGSRPGMAQRLGRVPAIEDSSYRIPVAPLDLHPSRIPSTMEEMIGVTLQKAVRHPFGYRMDEDSVRRVNNILNPGDVVVLAREPEPIMEHEIYAIWNGDSPDSGRIELAHALFNGKQLLILPGPGKNDFVVVETTHPYTVVVGHMLTVVRPSVPS